MGAYILRRLLLIIPTLIGIMVINLSLTQLVPGGPIEQVAARLEGDGDALESVSGGGDAGIDQGQDDGYIGARGLPPEFLAALEVQFGFARITCDEGFTGEPSVTAPQNACSAALGGAMASLPCCRSSSSMAYRSPWCSACCSPAPGRA